MNAKPADTYHVHSSILDAFVADVRARMVDMPDRARLVQTLRPSFARMLNDKTWLPVSFTEPDPSGGMGGGVGSYLIYLSGSRDLSLMSLVIPSGGGTPVHDHLAWGLVGLYSGEQEERVYRMTGIDERESRAELEETELRHIAPGDFYELLPPDGDIHQVHTVGDDASVSLHLLGNDIGCVWRHRYEPREHRVYSFRSGYSNESCLEGQPQQS